MEFLTRLLWLSIAVTVASALFHLVPRIMALAALQYRTPWLPVLPFGNEYAFADLALGDSDGLYVLGHRVPAAIVRWHGPVCLLLYLIPVIGWIAQITIRVAVGGPCLAWTLASLEGRDLPEENLKGAVTAVLPFTGTIILIIALARHGSRR